MITAVYNGEEKENNNNNNNNNDGLMEGYTGEDTLWTSVWFLTGHFILSYPSENIIAYEFTMAWGWGNILNFYFNIDGAEHRFEINMWTFIFQICHGKYILLKGIRNCTVLWGDLDLKIVTSAVILAPAVPAGAFWMSGFSWKIGIFFLKEKLNKKWKFLKYSPSLALSNKIRWN